MIGKSYQSINPMNHSSDICAENRKALYQPSQAFRIRNSFVMSSCSSSVFATYDGYITLAYSSS